MMSQAFECGFSFFLSFLVLTLRRATNTVDIYDTITGQWSSIATGLSQARYDLVATSADHFIFFAGGYTGSSASNVVDIYDTNTGLWTSSTLSQARFGLAATSIGSLVIFAGGYTAIGVSSNVIDIYDISSTRWSVSYLNQSRGGLAATTVASTSDAIFAGGLFGIQ